MKNFISKNWKNIFYIIGGILIVIDLFFIATTPASVSQDFLKYGPTVENDIVDSTTEFTENVELPKEDSGDSSLVEDISEGTGIPFDLTKVVIVFAIGLAVLLVLSSIMDGSGDSDKKKK